MTRSPEQRLLRHISDLNTWKRGDQRAPHKPLLLLLYLARIQRGEPRLVSFKSIDEPLSSLLKEFGPPRRSFHPEYPFWRLQNDGIWEVNAPDHIQLRGSNTDAKRSELLRHDVAGGLTEDYFDLLLNDPALVHKIAKSLLDEHFPESLHGEVASSVGLALPISTRQSAPRDPRFRPEVLAAYGYRCAICGLDVRLGSVSIGIEAAHIKWHQASGPSTVTNGLALCTLHHKALDIGALTLSDDHRVLLSSELSGYRWFGEMFLEIANKQIAAQSDSQLPGREFIRWHHREVFRKPDRERELT